MLGWCLLGALAAGPLFANGMADAIYDPKSWVSVGLSSPSRGRGQRLTLAFSIWAQLIRRRRRMLRTGVGTVYAYTSQQQFTGTLTHEGAKILRAVTATVTAMVTVTVTILLLVLGRGWLRCIANEAEYGARK